MSKIQINLELDSNKPNELKIVAKMLLELAGAPTISEAASDQQESQNEEAAPKKRASRAKPKTEQDAEASEASEAEETKAEETKAEETKAEETKTEEAEENKTEEPKAEEAEEPKAEEGIKLDDLRASLSLKVKSHRVEIKAKLTELGASNLTTLDAGKYADMNDFLKGLK